MMGLILMISGRVPSIIAIFIFLRVLFLRKEYCADYINFLMVILYVFEQRPGVEGGRGSAMAVKIYNLCNFINSDAC